jgi:hypothetical protein
VAIRGYIELLTSSPVDQFVVKGGTELGCRFIHIGWTLESTV